MHKDLETHKKYQKAYKSLNKDKCKKLNDNWRYKSKYNITLDDYNLMIKNQNGCCAICKIHFSKNNRALSVDHCHVTNIVRGLLCNNCNLGIAYFQDKILLLENAIKYLKNDK